MKNFKRGLAFVLTLAVVLMSSGLIFASAAPIGVVPASGVIEIVRPFSGRATEGVGFSIAVNINGIPLSDVEILNFGEPFGIATVNGDMWVGGDVQEGVNRPRPTAQGIGFHVLTVADPAPGMHYFTARATVGGVVHESEAVVVNVLPAAAAPTSIFNQNFVGYTVGTSGPPANWDAPQQNAGEVSSAATPGGPAGDISMRLERTTAGPAGFQSWWVNATSPSWGMLDGRFTVEMSFMAEQTTAGISLIRLGTPDQGGTNAFWTLLGLSNDGNMTINLSPNQADSVVIRSYAANTWYHVRYEMNFTEGERTLCLWVAEGNGAFVHYFNQVDISNRSNVAPPATASFNFGNAAGWRIDTMGQAGTWYISNFSATRPAQAFSLVDATLQNGDIALADVPVNVGRLDLNFNQSITAASRRPARLYMIHDGERINVPVTMQAATTSSPVITMNIPALRPGTAYELVTVAGMTSVGGETSSEQSVRFTTERSALWVDRVDFAAGSGNVLFTNDTGAVQNVVVVMSLQRGGATVENGVSVMNVAVPTGSHAEPFNLTGLPATAAGDVLRVFVWRSLANPRPLFSGASFTI